MPSLSLEIFNLLKDDYKKYDSFIETGTNAGDTIFSVEPFFKTLHTIEISEQHYNRTKSKYTGNKINFYLGDSSIVLSNILPDIKDDSIFFLDGHWSSGDTGRGYKDCPLVEEITHINNLFKNKAIIIIDDFRLFGRPPATDGTFCENWEDISKDKLVSILSNRIECIYHLDSSYAKDDRLIIHIKPL